jgi:hypothetical protein
MKKLYTLAAGLLLIGQARSQVVVNILEPVNLEGDLTSTWAKPDQGWGTPDMTILANGITDTLALAFDGSAADSLCCEAVINREDIEGKIAVLYRGTCNFSLKALNCQDSGAVAVMIINNVDAAPIEMGAGTFGADVTIPTFLVEKAGGQAVANALANGETIVAYLGNKTGLYEYDLGFLGDDILLPPSAAQPALFCQNSTEFSPVFGAWVRNYGQLDQTNVTLNVSVDLAGTGVVYNETSPAVDILSGDSAFVEMPALNLASYGGYYTITYTTSSPAGEEYAADNSYVTTLHVGNIYSKATLDANGATTSLAASRPSTPNGTFTYCIHFRDANASRAAATGMTVLAAVNAPATLAGEILTVQAFEWSDDFTGLSDPNFDISILNEVANGEVIIDPDTIRYSAFVPFSEPLPLVDNQRYLFCLASDNPDVVFLGSADEPVYDTNEEVLDQPTSPLQNGPDWSIGFAGTISSNSVTMVDANSIGIAEREETVGTPFPNPTVDQLHIPFKRGVKNAQLRIVNTAGQTISTQQVSTEMGQLVVDVKGIAPGTYTFDLTQLDGTRSTFRVVVAR